MHLLHEEGGDIKIATLLSGDVNSEKEALAVETLGGKRGKLKAKDVWLKFEHAHPTKMLEEAQIIAQEIDLDFLWECAGSGEFHFLDLAKEYFGEPSDVTQKTGLAIALQGAPIYFRRKGRGQFLRAPEDQLKAAIQAVERKKLELAKQEQWENDLRQGQLPEEIAPQVNALLFSPDKNTTAYKAVANASQGLKGGIAELFLKCGVLGSALAYHEGKFLKEHFPKGTGFQVQLQADEQAAWDVALEKLPVAEVEAFSIDDATTTEIDDAFSVTQIHDEALGTLFKVGVHIAAPALAIQRASELDAIARQRLSTVYYPGGKITMLPEAAVAAKNISDPGLLADMTAYTPDMTTEQRQELLEIVDVVDRLKYVSAFLARQIEILEIKGKIQSDVRSEMDKSQREYFLREQLKAIQRELGEDLLAEQAVAAFTAPDRVDQPLLAVEADRLDRQAGAPRHLAERLTLHLRRVHLLNQAAPQAQFILHGLRKLRKHQGLIRRNY